MNPLAMSSSAEYEDHWRSSQEPPARQLTKINCRDSRAQPFDRGIAHIPAGRSSFLFHF
jgi:hypothetical protein